MNELEFKQIKKTSQEEMDYFKDMFEQIKDISLNRTVSKRVENKVNLSIHKRLGNFMYMDGEIIQAVRHENRLNYYTLNGRLEHSVSKSQYFLNTNNCTGEKLRESNMSALTGRPVYINSNLIIDHLPTTESPSNIHKIGTYSWVFIDNSFVNQQNIFNIRPNSSTAYSEYGEYYCSIEDNFFSEISDKYLATLDETILASDYATHPICFDKTQEVFYIRTFNSEENKAKAYKLNTSKLQEMYYTLVEGCLFYVFKTNDEWSNVSSDNLYSNKSVEINNKYWVLDDNKDLSIKDNPYSKFPSIHSHDEDGFKITMEDATYEFKYMDFNYNAQGVLVENNSQYESTSSVEEDNIVLYSKSIFVVISTANDGHSIKVYDRKLSHGYDDVPNPLIIAYKNLRYKRLKSCFYTDDEALYTSEGYYIPLEEIQINSIKVIALNMISFKLKDNKRYILHAKGVISELLLDLNEFTEDNFCFNSCQTNNIHIGYCKDNINIIQCGENIVEFKEKKMFLNGNNIFPEVDFTCHADGDIYATSRNIFDKCLPTSIWLPLCTNTSMSFESCIDCNIDTDEEDFFETLTLYTPERKIRFLFGKKDSSVVEFNDYDFITDGMILKMEGNVVSLSIHGYNIQDEKILNYLKNKDTYYSMYDSIQAKSSLLKEMDDVESMVSIILEDFLKSSYSEIKNAGLYINFEEFLNFEDKDELIEISRAFNEVSRHFYGELSYLKKVLSKQVTQKTTFTEGDKFRKQAQIDFAENRINFSKYDSFNKVLNSSVYSCEDNYLLEDTASTCVKSLLNLLGDREFGLIGALNISSVDDIEDIENSILEEECFDSEVTNTQKFQRDLLSLEMISEEIQSKLLLKGIRINTDSNGIEVNFNKLSSLSPQEVLHCVDNIVDIFKFAKDKISKDISNIDVRERLLNIVSIHLENLLQTIKKEDLSKLQDIPVELKFLDNTDAFKTINLCRYVKKHLYHCAERERIILNLGHSLLYPFIKNVEVISKQTGETIAIASVVLKKISTSHNNQLFYCIDSFYAKEDFNSCVDSIISSIHSFMESHIMHFSPNKTMSIVSRKVYSYSALIETSYKVIGFFKKIGNPKTETGDSTLGLHKLY